MLGELVLKIPQVTRVTPYDALQVAYTLAAGVPAVEYAHAERFHGRPPFAVSRGLGSIAIRALTSDVLTAIADRAAALRTLTFGGAEVEVHEVKMQRWSSLDALFMEHLPNPVLHYKVSSPLSFARGGSFIEEPDVRLLMNSAFGTYRLIASERLPLLPVDKIHRAAESGENRRVHLGNNSFVNGWVGHGTWDLSEIDEEARRVIYGLMELVSWAGAGRKAAWGMGRMQVVPAGVAEAG